MPTTNRRPHRPQVPAFEDLPSDIQEFSDDGGEMEDLVDQDDVEEVEADVDEDELDPSSEHNSAAPPPAPHGLKEISSLASWTVSSSKPGCSVAALRAPTTALFWQSDGPQPHYLNIHFFKLVAIVGMRIYLDFDLDESYTPTVIRFAAGTGYNDLQEFSVMRFEQPRGWIDVDWDGVGDPEDCDADDEASLPLLHCMLVQVRVCENHQNGKDTHLRGLQIFARDTEKYRGLEAAKLPMEVLEPTRKKSKSGWNYGDWLDAPILR